MTLLVWRKKRNFSTTSMLCDRYSGFPPLHREPTKCLKGACPRLLYDRSMFNRLGHGNSCVSIGPKKKNSVHDLRPRTRTELPAHIVFHVLHITLTNVVISIVWLDFSKICLPHPRTTASLMFCRLAKFLVRWGDPLTQTTRITKAHIYKSMYLKIELKGFKTAY